MTSRTKRNTLERKILFFRADIGNDAGGRPLPFYPSAALGAIDALPFSHGPSGRYELEDNGNALCLFNHSNGQGLAARFCRVRRSGLPQLERAGQISNLDLPAESGLLEAIHVVFFPQTNIVGAEYNHYGPRVSRLGSYLYDKSNKAVPRAVFLSLLRGDAAEQLERLTDMRLLEFSIRPPFVDFVRQANQSLGDAFAANSRVLENPEILQVTLKPQKEDRQGLLTRIRESLRILFGSNEILEGAERLQVRGKCEDSGQVETIDLLKDQLVSVKSIVRMGERSRALDSASAFEAIREAYQQLEDDLEKAAGVSV